MQTIGSLAAQAVLLVSMVRTPLTLSELAPPIPHPEIDNRSLQDVLTYIDGAWGTLTRSMEQCQSLEDPKTDSEAIVYLPAGMAVPESLSKLQASCRVRIEHLPNQITKVGEFDASKIPGEGLLYLENPYVVPGGQFNEMYGWDSYFILRGLIREHSLELAKGMVENFFFEIEHYGGILNANRTYYLTRSQPPFLTSMILAIYEAEKAEGKTDLDWLERAYAFAERDHESWNKTPHLAGNTGLSRYYDFGDGPVPEIMGDPSQYYRGAADFFLAHENFAKLNLVREGAHETQKSAQEPRFPVLTCNAKADEAETGKCAPAYWVGLSSEFYKGDRSLRESGFDVTFRFGPFGAATHHFAAVCLNSLLYKTEMDLVEMSNILGHPERAEHWKQTAADRQKRMDKYFWDADEGMFFDYNFVVGKRSQYAYATTFYPLWAGLATKEQAKAIVQNLGVFEQHGGLAMSRTD
ncbi:MAG TPA: trehalase family glycosidase, partial [Candidatus Acidoferrales bacterium]|nr:trehalase family glycosidase [Candidatus Acidoferrales bacterium]